MRHPRKWQLAVVCLLVLALLPFAPAPRSTAQAPGYTVTDLGTLGAGEQSRAFGLDECGRVVGESQAVAGASAPFRPFRWNGTTMTDLGTLGGAAGTAYATNQSGTVTGSALTSGSLLHPFVRYEGASMFDLGTLAGGFTAEGRDINASGQVVGVTEEGSSQQDRAFIWIDANGNKANDANEMQALSAPWGTPIRAFGINDAGQVAGTANLPSSGTHAFVTIGGVAVDLGTLGGAVSVASEVNDSGEVCGYSYIPSTDINQSFHGFFWKDTNLSGQSDPGEMLDLGVLSGDRNSYAYDLNNAGQVVGASETGAAVNNTTRAFIWTSANGMQDLNVVAPGTGWTFREARGINNRGQIVGTGLNPAGKVHAFLLTPTNVGPSPCDPTPTPTPGTLQFSAATYTVGEGGGSAIISVSRTDGSDGAVSVNYATSNGTATAGLTGDYIATSGTLNFANGEVSKTFAVTINDDTTDEADETVNLTLSTPGGGATLGAQSTAVLTITDNDAAPTLSVNDTSVTEGNSGTTNATFTVSLSAASGKTVTVNYATANNTAVAPGDYTAIGSTTLTFNPGDTSKTFNVAVVGDTTDEPNESFFVNLSGATNATINDGQGEGTIVDDDGAPALSINDVSVTEGNGGQTAATFTVSLLPASGQAVSVNYATADGTATTADNDYAAKSGTLNFAIGETSKTITVNVNGDTTFESNETFNVNLSAATNATISDATGVGTITNDDATPAISIVDVTSNEGDVGGTLFTFNVSLSAASSLPVSVNYATADGTATAGSDYTAKSGTVNFAPGEILKTFDVLVTADTTWEPDETFFVNLSGASGATIADAQAVGTIKNDEVPSTFKFNSTTFSVGEGGQAAVVVSRTDSTAGNVSVNYATSAGSATPGVDYQESSGTLTFVQGEQFKTIPITTTNDTLDEPNETVTITLSSPVGGALATPSTATLTINDDDDPPTFQFSSANYSVNEGAGTATITVTRTGGTNGGVSVTYATQTGGTATAGSDYTATSGTLNFDPDEPSKTFTVAISEDALDEANETVNLALTNVSSNASLGTPVTAVLTINDNDPTPTLSIGDASVTEGNSGTTNAVFNVTLSAASGQTVTVNYLTSNGTAVEPGDYTATSGTLNFAPGETSKTVTVVVKGDTSNEADETFLVTLSGASNATLSDGQGLGTILNDDTPRLSFTQASYPSSENAHSVTINVTRTGDATLAATVDFATSDGTATERKDYTAVSGTLRFAAGETSKSFDVLLTDDSFQEPDETINLTLSNATGGATLGTQATATAVIAADDNPPPSFNTIDVSSNFVRQHYHDFLNREPDASGLAFWTNEIEQCGNDAQCREVKRINVSAAFFLSIEFQETGYLVYRTYKAAYGDATSPNVAGTVPVVRLNEFLPDTRRIGEDVVVNVGDWQAKLDANKNAYMGEFVQRQRFLTAYPLTLTAAQFVDKLNQNAGNVLTTAERDALVNDLSNGVKTRAQVLRAVSENSVLQQNEFRRAFVLMQFYGYLRRNPDDPQDTDFRGWKFWLDKLNDHNGNYIQAEMVKAFLDSIEYRTRFAP